MPPERALLCHGLAVVTGVLTYLGALAIEGLAGGDLARAFAREAVDVGAYWYFALPACYLVAGLLGYLGPARTWRWRRRERSQSFCSIERALRVHSRAS